MLNSKRAAEHVCSTVPHQPCGTMGCDRRFHIKTTLDWLILLFQIEPAPRRRDRRRSCTSRRLLPRLGDLWVAQSV